MLANGRLIANGPGIEGLSNLNAQRIGIMGTVYSVVE